jgi:hypothetical protein
LEAYIKQISKKEVIGMANNRSLEKGAVDGMQAALLVFEGGVFHEIVRGLAEGKKPASLKAKERHKIGYFQHLWETMDFKNVNTTEAKTVSDHFQIKLNSFDLSLNQYCWDNKLKKEEIFSEKKILLFQHVIKLRQMVALQRYHLNNFTPAESHLSVARHTAALHSRCVHAQGRMQDLGRKLAELALENEAIVDFIAVLVQHVQMKSFGFVGVEEPAFEKRYENNSDLWRLSTALLSLPDQNMLRRASNHFNGKIKADRPELDAARATLAAGEPVLKEIIELFEAKNGWVFQRHEYHLKAWFRRQQELAHLVEGLETDSLETLFSKVQALRFTHLEAPLQAVLESCAGMPNGVLHGSPSKLGTLCGSPWPSVADKIAEAGAVLKQQSSDFCLPYEAHRDLFNGSKELFDEFTAWQQDRLNPQIESYKNNLNKLLGYRNDFLKTLYAYHDLTLKYSLKTHALAASFFKKHAIEMSVGGVLNATLVFLLCFYLFELELPECLIYGAVALLAGVGGGAAEGAVRDRCCPAKAENQSLLVVEEKPVKKGGLVDSSYRVASYAMRLYPAIQYQKQAPDVEKAVPLKPTHSYGSID